MLGWLLNAGRSGVLGAVFAGGCLAWGHSVLAEAPGYFAGVADAQPIEAAANPAAVLRWKNKRPAAGGANAAIAHASAADAEAADRAAVSSRRKHRDGGWNTSKIGATAQPADTAGGVIRLANYDPFHDPFGDRLAHADHEPSLLAPAKTSHTAPADDAEPEEKPAAPPKRKPVHDELAPAEIAPDAGHAKPLDPPAKKTPKIIEEPPAILPEPREQPPAPQEPPRTKTPRERLNPRSADEGQAGDREPPCARIYKDLDCCKGDKECSQFYRDLNVNSIRQISLDITPRYKPDRTPEQNREARQDLHRLSGAREWRDREGNVIATGRLANLSFGRAVIADDSGATVAKIPFTRLGPDEACFIAGWWEIPVECIDADEKLVARDWIPSTLNWHASAVCHKPLYFEEVQLERYGHTLGPVAQPIFSTAHFFVNIAVLPYKMGINPPQECQYVLGYYRPGSCAPWHIPPVPLSVRGALSEAGAWVGGVAIFP